MPCTACHKELPGDFRFCPHCGAEQPAACRSCGARIEGSFAFCPHCGAARVSPPRDRKPVAARASQAFPRPFTGVARRGERRVVTVLFADVVGFTKLSERYDAETLTEMMNRLFERFGAVVRRYEGVVDKFIGDAAMVLFGAPTAHEDDAERAVLTARDMMALLPAVNADFRSTLGIDPRIQIHVGIATGLVVAGSVAPEEGGGYTVMGDAVNLASRLEDISPPGEIYIAESTYRLVSGRVRAEVVQTLKVKGKDEPVTVYKVTGADPAAGDSRGLSAFYSPMVGRSADMGALTKAFAELAEGRGGIVVIDGPAGVGKSRLVRESLESIDHEGVRPRVHLGRCISYGRTVPYYPWSQILSSLLTESILHRLTPDEVCVLQQVSTGAFGNRTPAEAERHRATVFDAFGRLVASASQNAPRILVLEDMHWADTTTADLALALLPMMRTSRVLLMIVMRSKGSATRIPADLSRVLAMAGTAVHVRPLSIEETKLLIGNLTCNVAGFDERVLEQIALRSEGLPLFVEEILRSYVEEGLLVRELDFWRFQRRSGPAADTVPTSLHALLSARVDRIPPQHRARLELASVIGKDFDPRLVDRLLSLPHEPGPWRELESDGEIQRAPDPGGGRDRYRFAQVLTQEVIYATLLRTRRQELHGAVAKALEGERTTLEENYHSLAYHFEQAGTPERAAPYYLAAASQAMGVYANREALDLYDHALRVAPSAQAAIEALLGKARLLNRLGAHADAAEAFERLVEMARARGDAAEESSMLAERAWVAYHAGDGAGILRFAERAIQRASDAASPRARVLPLRVLGVAHEFLGNYDKAKEAYGRLLAIAETFDDRPQVAGTYNSLGEIARTSEEWEEALGWYERAFDPSQRASLLSSYHMNVAATLCGMGSHRQGLEMLDPCIEERRKKGYLSHLSEALYYRGVAHLGLGDVPGAEQDARDAMELSTRTQETEMAGLALRLGAAVVAAGGTFARDGAPLTAEAALRASVRIFQSSGKKHEEARSRHELGLVLRRSGRTDEAQTEIARAVELFTELGLPVPAARVARDLELSPVPAEGARPQSQPSRDSLM